MKVITTGAEPKLLETLTSLRQNPAQWTCVYFAFSDLLEHYRSEYQIKIAINLISDLLKQEECTVFVCKDSTIFLLAYALQPALLDKVIFQLRYLFMDDPLAYTSDGEENKAFSSAFVLSDGMQKAIDLAQAKMLEGMRPRQSTGAAAAAGPSKIQNLLGQVKQAQKERAVSPGSSKFFNASSLASIERDLQNADLSSVVRRQPICAAIPDMMVRRVFDELYINISQLRNMLRVDTDLLSNKWLFKYLTEILDLRVLELIKHNPARYLELPISLNLNIKTLMSDQFLEFDASVKPSVKVSVVIEIQVSDVFEDTRAFKVARETVQKLGYRVCLDGLSDLSFWMIDREKLGFDLLKLQWNANITADMKSRENQKILEAIKQCGPNRVILSRCDNRKAVDYGQELGISLFQGRYLDKLMNPLSKVEN
ncbi:MAG: EAL domain-containing protein [Rickettsiales bacterium]